MQFLLNLFLFFSACSLVCSSEPVLRSGPFCFEACQYTLRTIRFNDTVPGKPKGARMCFSRFGVESLFLCLRVYCERGSSGEEGLRGLNETCVGYGAELPGFEAVVEGFTDEDVVRMRHLGREEAMRATVANGTVIPGERLFGLSFETLRVAKYEYESHKYYGYTLYWFWIAVFSVSAITRFRTLIAFFGSKEWVPIPHDDIEPETQSLKKKRTLLERVRAYWKGYVGVPAAFGYRCAQNVGWCTIPPRIQSLTIGVFVAINLFYCFWDYTVFPGNMYWTEVHTQYLRYVSDRTGIISFMNFPVIWLFATRNNVVEFLTGWSFATCTNFHRWVARVATLQAVIHSVGYTWMVMEQGGWEHFMFYWTKRYWYMGEVATIFMCLISICSVYPLRRRLYELFLVLHIYLSFVALITMWYHVEIFLGEYDVFFWPCAILWGLDRFLRFNRILILNPRFWKKTATVSYNPDSNIIRVVAETNGRILKPYPGAFYYIYTLNHLRFWESHPFTLAYCTTDGDAAHPTLKPAKQPLVRRLSTFSNRSRSPAQSTECDELLGSDSSSSLVFLIRFYDGFTSRLKNAATSNGQSLHVLLEGPYGESDHLSAFQNILFIVGGSGIAVPLSVLESLLHSEHSPGPSSITIVWAVREPEFCSEVLDTDLRLCILGEYHARLRVEVYCTKGREGAEALKEYVNQGNGTDVTVLGGRPDIRERVVGEGMRCRLEGERLAVVACGPAGMADEVRSSVVEVLRRGEGWDGIEFLDKGFSW